MQRSFFRNGFGEKKQRPYGQGLLYKGKACGPTSQFTNPGSAGHATYSKSPLLRPATLTDFISIYRDFLPLEFGKIQIFSGMRNVFFFFSLVVQIFSLKYRFSLSFMLILC